MPRAPLLPSVALLALTSIAVAAPPTSAPATGPSLPPGEESSRPSLVAEQAGLPKLEPQPIGQLLGITLEDQFLRVSTRGAAPRGQYAVQIADWPGFVTIQHFGLSMFKLDHVALSENDTVEARTTVIVRPDYLQLVRETETLTMVRSITLMQSRQFADASGDPVRLSVRETSKDDNHPAKPAIAISAPTFSELTQDHSAVVREHLQPILRDLGAAGVLRDTNPARAWQVLGPMLPPDSKLAGQIDALLKRLDADDFADRTKAEEALSALGPAGAAELRRRDLNKLSPDARSAVDNALRHAEPLTPAKAQQLGHDVTFLTDSLMLSDARLAGAAARRLAEVTGKPIDLPADLSTVERERRIAEYTAALNPATQPTTSPATETR